jgi:hypothetical protein
VQNAAFFHRRRPARLDKADHLDVALMKTTQHTLPDDERGILGDPVPGCHDHDPLKQIAQTLRRGIRAIGVIHIEDYCRAGLT